MINLQTSHGRLLRLRDEEIAVLWPEATHQHYKGGLYKLLGRVRDAENGKIVADENGTSLFYRHVGPHSPEFWVRSEANFHGTIEWTEKLQVPDRDTEDLISIYGTTGAIPRFRRLTEQWSWPV